MFSMSSKAFLDASKRQLSSSAHETDTKKAKYDEANLSTDTSMSSQPDYEIKFENTSSQSSNDQSYIGIDTFTNENMFFEFVENELIVAALDSHENFCFKGRASICVLYGSVEVNAYKMDASDKFYDLYSPDCNSFLVLSALNAQSPQNEANSLNAIFQFIMSHVNADMNKEQELSDEDMKAMHDKANALKDYLDAFKEKNFTSLFVLRKLKSQLCNYLNHFENYNQLYQSYNYKLYLNETSPNFTTTNPATNADINFAHLDLYAVDSQQYDLRNKLLKQTKAERNIIEYIINDAPKAPVLLAAGGKDVGKSTFLRYFVNSCLATRKYRRVAYLDCDPGQCEFTLSGCVQLTIISEPIFGPPHTHLAHSAENCFFLGHLSPSDAPELYVQCVRKCAEKFAELNDESVPLIVNTMGWNQGLGLCLLKEQISLLKPNYVVQINSEDYNRNMPKLDYDWYEKASGWPAYPPREYAKGNFKLFTITRKSVGNEASFASSSKTKRKNYIAKTHRNIATIAYFANLHDTSHYFKPIHYLKPYRVPWSRFAVHVLHKNVAFDEMFGVLNASIVGLCVCDERFMKRASQNRELPSVVDVNHRGEIALFNCVGFGIVRGINTETKEFYLLTPEPVEKLNMVNLLVKGMLNVPLEFFYEQDSVTASPYVTIASSSDNTMASEPAQRRFLIHQSGKK